MINGERIGVRAYAWSEADRAAIMGHFIDLLVALETAVGMLRGTAYNVHQRHKLDHMQAVLERAPPNGGRPPA